MADPRWTIDENEDGPRLVWRWPGVELSYVDRKYVRRISPTAYGALVATVRDAARIPELESRLRQLEDALLWVSAELPTRETLLLREQAPQLADFIGHLHHSIEHEQAMVRRNVWADLLSSPAPQGEGT